MLKKAIAILMFLAALIQFTGCCGRKKIKTGRSKSSSYISKNDLEKKPAVEKPLSILEKTGLNYSVGSSYSNQRRSQQPNSLFEQRYMQGVEYMEKDDIANAMKTFEELLRQYPSGEEASIVELCIAELYFRAKSNSMALALYKKIVERYPNSHAAENARAGIEYLENFERYVEEHVPPEIEMQKRMRR